VEAVLHRQTSARLRRKRLHMHRTTLYWRLAAAAELVPLDLRRGEDRLKLHLALALADLTQPPAELAG
jgi:DNA-binding PucR family transcriptional regulator